MPSRAPRRAALLLEARAALDVAVMLPAMLRMRRKPAQPDASPVVLLPGFGTDGRYFIPLARHLRRLGYPVEDWGLGTNFAGLDHHHVLADLSDSWQVEPRTDYRQEASVPYLCDLMKQRVTQRYSALQRPITLIGWSLGGYVAREVARDMPDQVEQIITMGSPTIGGPKYTAAAAVFRNRGMDLDWIEAEIAQREQRAITVPVTAIYSKRDAIVHWQAALDRSSVNVRHIEVRTAHMGMGFSPVIWQHIEDALAAQRPGVPSD